MQKKQVVFMVGYFNTYLYNVTKSWTKVEPVNYSCYDKEVQGGEYRYHSTKGIAVITAGDGTTTNAIGTEPLRTRMPVYTENTTYTSLNEVAAKIEATQFLYNNLDSSETNGPYGYWTLAIYFPLSNSAFTVDLYGIVDVYGRIVNFDSTFVVRPVITVEL